MHCSARVTTRTGLFAAPIAVVSFSGGRTGVKIAIVILIMSLFRATMSIFPMARSHEIFVSMAG